MKSEHPHSTAPMILLLLSALVAWSGTVGATNEGLTEAIDRALADEPGYLRIFTECQTDSGLQTVEIFASGVVISDSTEQLLVSPVEIRHALQAVQETGFAAMPHQFGGSKAPDAGPPDEPPALAALELLCRVELTIGATSVDTVSKQVVQLSRGEQSPQLRDLATLLLALRDKADRPAGTASSLSDGLSKVARQELAAETVEVLFHRKPDRTESTGRCLLRLSGGRGEAQYDDSVTPIHTDEIRRLAGNLASLALDDLPENLHSDAYTDLHIGVLNQNVTIQSRAFSGMTSSTHGDHQQQYDRATRLLESLCRSSTGS